LSATPQSFSGSPTKQQHCMDLPSLVLNTTAHAV